MRRHNSASGKIQRLDSFSPIPNRNGTNRRSLGDQAAGVRGGDGFGLAFGNAHAYQCAAEFDEFDPQGVGGVGCG